MTYVDPKSLLKTRKVLNDIATERLAQDAEFGEQHHPDGTGAEYLSYAADQARKLCDEATAQGKLTWRHISDEEMAEAKAESDPVKLRRELIQQAAVLVNWIEDIDSRGVLRVGDPKAATEKV